MFLGSSVTKPDSASYVNLLMKVSSAREKAAQLFLKATSK